MLDVQHLGRVKIVEKLPTLGGVLPMVGQVRNPLFLLCNVPLTFGNVPIGLFQMPQQHRAIHATVYTTSEISSATSRSLFGQRGRLCPSSFGLSRSGPASLAATMQKVNRDCRAHLPTARQPQPTFFQDTEVADLFKAPLEEAGVVLLANDLFPQFRLRRFDFGLGRAGILSGEPLGTQPQHVCVCRRFLGPVSGVALRGLGELLFR